MPEFDDQAPLEVIAINCLFLRLARALDLMSHYDDPTALGLALGFSSHSHFSAAFRETCGRSPREFRQSALNC